MKTKRAALYVRVSSGEQNTGAQERALKEYVQRRGWKLQAIYQDQFQLQCQVGKEILGVGGQKNFNTVLEKSR